MSSQRRPVLSLTDFGKLVASALDGEDDADSLASKLTLSPSKNDPGAEFYPVQRSQLASSTSFFTSAVTAMSCSPSTVSLSTMNLSPRSCLPHSPSPSQFLAKLKRVVSKSPVNSPPSPHDDDFPKPSPRLSFVSLSSSLNDEDDDSDCVPYLPLVAQYERSSPYFAPPSPSLVSLTSLFPAPPKDSSHVPTNSRASIGSSRSSSTSAPPSPASSVSSLLPTTPVTPPFGLSEDGVKAHRTRPQPLPPLPPRYPAPSCPLPSPPLSSCEDDNFSFVNIQSQTSSSEDDSLSQNMSVGRQVRAGVRGGKEWTLGLGIPKQVPGGNVVLARPLSVDAGLFESQNAQNLKRGRKRVRSTPANSSPSVPAYKITRPEETTQKVKIEEPVKISENESVKMLQPNSISRSKSRSTVNMKAEEDLEEKQEKPQDWTLSLPLLPPSRRLRVVSFGTAALNSPPVEDKHRMRVSSATPRIQVCKPIKLTHATSLPIVRTIPPSPTILPLDILPLPATTSSVTPESHPRTSLASGTSPVHTILQSSSLTHLARNSVESSSPLWLSRRPLPSAASPPSSYVPPISPPSPILTTSPLASFDTVAPLSPPLSPHKPPSPTTVFSLRRSGSSSRSTISCSSNYSTSRSTTTAMLPLTTESRISVCTNYSAVTSSSADTTTSKATNSSAATVVPTVVQRQSTDSWGTADQKEHIGSYGRKIDDSMASLDNNDFGEDLNLYNGGSNASAIAEVGVNSDIETDEESLRSGTYYSARSSYGGGRSSPEISEWESARSALSRFR